MTFEALLGQASDIMRVHGVERAVLFGSQLRRVEPSGFLMSSTGARVTPVSINGLNRC